MVHHPDFFISFTGIILDHYIFPSFKYKNKSKRCHIDLE